MRLTPLLLCLPLFALQAHAQTAPAQQAAPALAGAARAAPAPATQHHRLSWQQRFAQANATHDGHLTLEEATAGYKTIARHFAEIDVGKKGYVTVEDIDAWHKLQRAVRRAHHEQPDSALRPRPAMQHGVTEPMTQPAEPATNSVDTTEPKHGT